MRSVIKIDSIVPLYAKIDDIVGPKESSNMDGIVVGLEFVFLGGFVLMIRKGAKKEKNNQLLTKRDNCHTWPPSLDSIF